LFYSKGIGEFPLLMQATFSIWSSADAMMDYAYNTPKHAEMIKKQEHLIGILKNYLSVLSLITWKEI
jgi:uncharacterized membrane protein YpjA